MSKILTVWGAPGSGKTLFSFKLAAELLRQDKSVLLVLANSVTPALPVAQPKAIRAHLSLGELLLKPALTQDDILRYSSVYGKSKECAIVGYKYGDNANSYADHTPEAVREMLLLAKHCADFVIVDVFSNLVASAITAIALEMSDISFQIVNATTKSVVFLESASKMLAAKRFRYQEFITVLNNVYDDQVLQPYLETYGGVAYMLPHIPELRCQFESDEEQLLQKVSGRDKKHYRKVFDAILSEMREKECL